MEKELFDDLLQSLNEAVEYSKGDTTKGRSMTVSIPDDEIEMNQELIREFSKLSNSNKLKTIQYVTDLQRASNH